MVILPGRRKGYLGNDAYTKLLLHFDGADAATSTVDSSSGGKAVTFGGSAALKTAQAKFGPTSLLCGAGGSDFVSLADSADWDFGTGSLCIDFQYYLAALPGSGQINYLYHRTPAAPATDYTRFTYRESAGHYFFKFMQVESGSFTIEVEGEHTLATGAWNHVALVRNGNDFSIYVNGAQIANATDSTGIADWTAGISIGESTVAAYFDEYRISVGTPRWTGAFNPYETPYR